MFIGGFIATSAKSAGSKISSTIDQNDSLANARDVTKEKLGQAAGFMKSGFTSLYSKIAPKKPAQ